MFSLWKGYQLHVADATRSLTSVAFWIHAVCAHKATRPPNDTRPLTLRISPIRPMSKLDWGEKNQP